MVLGPCSFEKALPHLARDGHTHAREWASAQTILAIGARVLERLLPTIASLLPVYEPIVVALMISSIKLAGRVSLELNSDKCDGIHSEEDAA